MSRTRTTILIILALFIVVSGIFLYQIIQWAGQPASEEIRISQTEAQPEKPVGDQDLTTQYFETVVPGDFRIQTSDVPVDQKDLIQVVAYEKSGSKRQVGIRSNILPAGGLKEVGDLNYRVKTPEEYASYNNEYLPAGSQAFRKQDGTEITVFLQNGNRYASVAVLAKADPSKLEELLFKVMNNWQWK